MEMKERGGKEWWILRAVRKREVAAIGSVKWRFPMPRSGQVSLSLLRLSGRVSVLHVCSGQISLQLALFVPSTTNFYLYLNIFIFFSKSIYI